MISSGLSKLGYQYINLDDCWADTTDTQGNIQADVSRFPSGMKALVDKIHGLGLKFGLYTCAGTYTCSPGGRNHQIPGSFGHYQQDANTFASWGVDFVKMDWCNTNGLTPKVQYPQFTEALNATGRPIFFEMCEWGVQQPWQWATPVANQWRTSGDHHDQWSSTLSVINNQAGLSKYASTGAWNYMDFIYTGGQGCANDVNNHCPGQKDPEYITEFSFWSLLNSGLIVATDIRNLTPIMKEVLFNTEVIAINQDELRKEGDRVYMNGTLQIWAKPLASGAESVILFNTGESAMMITANYTMWGWTDKTSAKVRNLWTHTDEGIFTGSYKASVDPHGVVMVQLMKQ